jgi:hypothetical protein
MYIVLHAMPSQSVSAFAMYDADKLNSKNVIHVTAIPCDSSSRYLPSKTILPVLEHLPRQRLGLHLVFDIHSRGTWEVSSDRIVQQRVRST